MKIKQRKLNKQTDPYAHLVAVTTRHLRKFIDINNHVKQSVYLKGNLGRWVQYAEAVRQIIVNPTK